MIAEVLSSALLMIIMIDPSDKILLVSLLREDFHIEDIKQLIVRANLIGFFLLILFALAGKEKNILALAAVPVATPLIAGPAAITTAITLTAEYGVEVSALAIIIAILTTALIMIITLYAVENISKTTLGVFIRIIGLFTMAIGAQMMVEGVGGIFLKLMASTTF